MTRCLAVGLVIVVLAGAMKTLHGQPHGSSLPRTAPAELQRMSDGTGEPWSWEEPTPQFSARLFEARWKRDLNAGLMPPGVQPPVVRLRPQVLAALVGEDLVLLDPTSGTEISRIPVPEEGRQFNEMHQSPQYVVLRDTCRTVAVAVQTFYEVDTTEHGGKTFRPHTRQLAAFDEQGENLWHLELEDFGILEAAAVPGPGEPLLLLVGWDVFRLYTSSGELFVEQRIGVGHRLIVTDTDADDLADFIVIGSSIARYELTAAPK